MKNKKPLPQLKKVKIDEHIENSKKGNNSAPPRKRGRPKKNSELARPGATEPVGSPPPSEPDSSEIAESISTAPSGAAVMPIYDTTAEARGALASIFETPAALLRIKELALYPEELEAAAPSFKVVYDINIKPWLEKYLGENAHIAAFALVMVPIVGKKARIVMEHFDKKKQVESQPNKTDSSGYPSIPANQNPVQMSQ